MFFYDCLNSLEYTLNLDICMLLIDHLKSLIKIELNYFNAILTNTFFKKEMKL